jgi:hypothetical protein
MSAPACHCHTVHLNQAPMEPLHGTTSVQPLVISIHFPADLFVALLAPLHTLSSFPSTPPKHTSMLLECMPYTAETIRNPGTYNTEAHRGGSDTHPLPGASLQPFPLALHTTGSILTSQEMKLWLYLATPQSHLVPYPISPPPFANGILFTNRLLLEVRLIPPLTSWRVLDKQPDLVLVPTPGKQY